jgi:hypothetical protein
MMKHLLAVLLTTLCLSPSALCQSTYDFLRNDMSARAAGLNGSFVSMADDPNVLFYNPAALTTLSQPKASLSYLKHLLDVNAGSLVYGQEFAGIGSVAGGIVYINYGTFTETDPSSNIVGTFGAGELALVGGWGMKVDEQTAVGVNVKAIYSSMADYRSAAVAVDAGVFYSIPSEQITIGASILNLGRQVNSFAATREDLPLDVKLGITKRPEHLPVLLSLNFHKLNERQENLLQRFSTFTVGAEFQMSESVRLRVGFDNEKRKELRLGTGAGLAGFSLGAGFLYQDYQFDYAFNSYGKIGGLHRISLGMNL